MNNISQRTKNKLVKADAKSFTVEDFYKYTKLYSLLFILSLPLIILGIAISISAYWWIPMEQTNSKGFENKTLFLTCGMIGVGFIATLAFLIGIAGQKARAYKAIYYVLDKRDEHDFKDLAVKFDHLSQLKFTMLSIYTSSKFITYFQVMRIGVISRVFFYVIYFFSATWINIGVYKRINKLAKRDKIEVGAAVLLKLASSFFALAFLLGFAVTLTMFVGIYNVSEGSRLGVPILFLALSLILIVLTLYIPPFVLFLNNPWDLKLITKTYLWILTILSIYSISIMVAMFA